MTPVPAPSGILQLASRSLRRLSLATRFVPLVVASACVLVVSCAAQQPVPGACPLEFWGIQYMGHYALLSPTGARIQNGVLSFRYKNASGSEIAAFTVQASTEMQVVGPTRPAMVGTSTYVDVSKPVKAGESKREKAKVSLSSTTTRVWLWLKHVTFSDGRNWDNARPSQCVFVPRSKGVVARGGPV